MESATQQPDANVEAELAQRHRIAAITVASLLVAAILLALVAFLAKAFLRQQQRPALDVALRITILIFGLGSVALRRTRFAAVRLQAIGGLKGVRGLLDTFERTTLQLALLGAAISVMGFVATLLTGNEFYAYGGSLVSLAVLLYAYPTRSSWRRAIQQFAQSSSGDSAQSG